MSKHSQLRAARRQCCSCAEPATRGSRCEKHWLIAKNRAATAYTTAIAAGLCGMCKKAPRDPESKSCCRACLDKQNAKRKDKGSKLRTEAKQDLLDRKVCLNCKEQQVTEGHTVCATCLDILEKTQDANTYYERKRALGLCANCQKPSLPGRVRCAVHTAYKAQHHQDHIASGRCPKHPDLPLVPGKRQCSTCIEERRAEHQHCVDAKICTRCKEKPPETDKKQCANCLVISRAVDRRKYYRLRDRVFAAYGGSVCKCCGEKNQVFLQIDHVNNDGYAHRKAIGGQGSGRLYTWLRKHDYPDGFQVLCANCNWAKRLTGTCPHKQVAPPE